MKKLFIILLIIQVFYALPFQGSELSIERSRHSRERFQPFVTARISSSILATVYIRMISSAQGQRAPQGLSLRMTRSYHWALR
jgi:hypothetical protein